MAKDAKAGLKFLLIAQFFGAFNDNAWKLIVTFLAIKAATAHLTPGGPEYQSAAQFQTAIAFCVLTIPLMVFSLPAGLVADRVSKRTVIIAMKLAEVLLMAAAALSLYAAPGSTLAPLVILGFMGLQSALFSPAKYGILPEMLPHERLTAGNAHLETWTFLAIILGTASGGLLLDLSGESAWTAAAVLVPAAIVGLLISLRLPRVPAARAEGDLAETIRTAWRAIRRERVLGLAVAGSVVYWTIASLLGQDILVYVKSVLGLSDTHAGIPLALFGLGVGGGSLITARLSRGKVEYGVIPLGAVLMAGNCLLLALVVPGFSGLLAFCAALGVASGMIIVPLNSLLQWRAPAQHRGAVIALANVWIFAGITVGSLGAAGLAALGLSPVSILLVAALALSAGMFWAVSLLPDVLLRLLLVLATHSLYRLRVVGREHVPEKGGALLVPNHVSFIDFVLLLAVIDRPIRFIVHREYYERFYFKPFMKSLGCIPISSSEGPREILRALRNAGKRLDQGELVCIFPEGSDQPNRHSAALQPGPGADREEAAGTHHSRLPGPTLGEHLQLRAKPVRLQDSAGDPLPGHSGLRRPVAFENERGNDPPSCPGAVLCRVEPPSGGCSSLAPGLRAQGQDASAGSRLCRGKPAASEPHQGPDRSRGPGPGAEIGMGRTGESRDTTATHRRCGPDESGLGPGLQGDRQPELHRRLARDGVGRGTSGSQDRRHQPHVSAEGGPDPSRKRPAHLSGGAGRRHRRRTSNLQPGWRLFCSPHAGWKSCAEPPGSPALRTS